MRFEAYHHLDGRPNVVVDGSPTEGTVLTVTHWPGYPPPEAVADDLSAQMAFRLLDHPELVPDGVELVSNNHFDQDGLVSLFALCRPDEALARQPFLEDVARAGDFAVYQDRDAARVSMVLSAMAGDDGRPDDYMERTAGLYEELLGRLPELCDGIQRHRDLWAEEDASLAASEAALASGAVQLEEVPDVELAVVTVPSDAPDAGGHRFGGDWAHGLHPMAVCGATDRLVVATVREGRYEVEHRYETWVQLRSRPLRERRDLVPLAERLQDEEPASTVWSATDVGGLIPRLTTAGEPSGIAPGRFVELVVGHLRTAPPAWDPFVPDP